MDKTHSRLPWIIKGASTEGKCVLRESTLFIYKLFT